MSVKEFAELFAFYLLSQPQSRFLKVNRIGSEFRVTKTTRCKNWAFYRKNVSVAFYNHEISDENCGKLKKQKTQKLNFNQIAKLKIAGELQLPKHLLKSGQPWTNNQQQQQQKKRFASLM